MSDDTEMEVDTPPADTSQEKDSSQENEKGNKSVEFDSNLFLSNLHTAQNNPHQS